MASAAAAAISAAVEGSPQTADAVTKAGGLDLLLSIMKKGSPNCKTSAVEALQVPIARPDTLRIVMQWQKHAIKVMSEAEGTVFVRYMAPRPFLHSKAQ